MSDMEDAGRGGGSDRFAYLIAAVVVGKAVGVMGMLGGVLPGFFGYKIASVVEGFRDWD